MPLINELHPSTDGTDVSLQVKGPASVREGKDSGYEDFGEFEEGDDCLDSDMEGSIIHRARPKKTARPALPARSERRTSKLLADVMKELQNLDGSQEKEKDKPAAVQEKDPHEEYLSSEEDASLSDDYEDSLLDLDLDAIEVVEVEGQTRDTTSRASSRRSQEDTARVVSMVFMKPQIVDIHISNSATSSPIKDTRRSLDLETLVSTQSSSEPSKQRQNRPSPLTFRTNSMRRTSISSVSSLTHTPASFHTAHSNQSISNLPSRKSSRLADLTSLVTSAKATLQTTSHAFLNTDPYASSQSEQKDQSQSDESTAPKTPTSAAASAFKKGLSRGLGRARKPSMQRLSAAYNAAANGSRTSLVKERVSPEQTPKPEPVRYQDIMDAVKRAPPPPPLSATSPKARTASLFMGRRKSIKH